MLADAIVADLNPEQRAAVETTEGPLLVLAGAGSGKTRVLTHRIAWLIASCGIAPEAILAVTFTNKAAAEMRERVAKLLGPDAAGLWVSTFHSTCVRILRREIERLGRPRSFVIYDDGESQAVLREALRRHGADPRGPDARRTHWRIDQWKNAGLRPDEAAAGARDADDELTAGLYRTYQKLLVEANAVDFGDLLLLVSELFAQHPEALASYRERWQYVLVDEYQDTNRVQYDLVTRLAGEHRNLCVVGDADQSIYGWRGADVRNILDFERDFPESRVVTLDRNYRSTRPILAGADAVVSNNRARHEKTMRAERGEGEPIRLYRGRDERDEAQFVVQGILEGARSEGRPYGHFAIFYRTNAQSRPFEEELLKYDVPYAVVGGVRFYDRAEVKDVLAYLRLVVNPLDAVALRRIVNVPARGIGKATLERADALAEARGLAARRGARARRRRGRALRPPRRRVPAARGGAPRVARAARARRGHRPRARPHGLPARARARGHARGGGARREPARARLGGGGLRGLRGRRPHAARAVPRPGGPRLRPRRLRAARRPRVADDGPLGEGARVPRGVPRRDGGGHLPPRGLRARRPLDRGGAPALLRRHDARDGAAHAHAGRSSAGATARAASARRRASSRRSRRPSWSARRRTPTTRRRRRSARSARAARSTTRSPTTTRPRPPAAARGARVRHPIFGEGVVLESTGSRAPGASSASASTAPASRP